MPIAATKSPFHSHRLLSVLLIVIAAVELLDALSGVPNIFHDYGHTTTLLKVAQAITSVKLALAPLIAAAAFVLALMQYLGLAIAALAVLILVTWAEGLSDIPIHGWEISRDFGGVVMMLHRFVYPALAVWALILVSDGRRLGLAGLLVSVPTILHWIGVALFMASIIMYGF